jgi:ATP-binding cassette subfamily C protein CydD
MKPGRQAVIPGGMARSLPRTLWLNRAAAAAGWRNRAAAALLVLDGLAAIGFAAALAGALAALPRGLAAASPWMGAGVAAALARGAGAWGSARVGAAASARARGALRTRLTACWLGQAATMPRQPGETLALLVDAVETMDGFVARLLPAQRAAGPVTLLVLAAVACASLPCAAILVATMVPFVLTMILAGHAAAAESGRQFGALRRLSGLFADHVRALPIVLAFQAEDAVAGRLGQASEELGRRTMGLLRLAFLSSAGLELFAALSVAFTAVYCGFDLLGLLPFAAPERLDLGRAVFVLALAPEFYAPMRRLAAAYHDRQAAETAADALMALEARPAAPRAPALVLTRPPRLRFEAASVRYPGCDAPALDGFELAVAPGEIVALLGPSGCGKTTVLHLLLGLAPLAGGEVWIDDHALSQIGSLAGSAAWAGQAPVILEGSLAANIALSRRGAGHAEVARAAAQAGLAVTRPGGLDATVDERGGGLSGGERRRLALARALLVPAPLLLLDEPTAHLDAGAEAALIDTIRRAASGRTTLIATHSRPLAAIAHRVVRMALP